MNLAASLLFHKHNINLNIVFRLVEPQKTDYYQENFGVDIAFKDGLIDVTFNMLAYNFLCRQGSSFSLVHVQCGRHRVTKPHSDYFSPYEDEFENTSNSNQMTHLCLYCQIIFFFELYPHV